MVLLIDRKDRLCVSISRFLLSPPHLLLLRSLNLRSMIRSHSHKRLSKCHPLIFRVRTTAYNSSAEPRRSDRPPRMERHERTHARMQSVVVVFSPALIVAGRALGRRKNITSLLQTDPGSMGEKKKSTETLVAAFFVAFPRFQKVVSYPTTRCTTGLCPMYSVVMGGAEILLFRILCRATWDGVAYGDGGTSALGRTDDPLASPILFPLASRGLRIRLPSA